MEVGSRVKLTKSMRLAVTEPEKYETGVVTQMGPLDIFKVKWNGIYHPIAVRRDEIEEV